MLIKLRLPVGVEEGVQLWSPDDFRPMLEKKVTAGLHRYLAFIPFSYKNMKMAPYKHACGLTQGQPAALGKKTLLVSRYDKEGSNSGIYSRPLPFNTWR